ncbi:putative steryl acetyl hydrolase mug81 [Vanrija albida]|uniref:Steryl acetyl hydrolase mug81 n=1 Tax=Vanrija albida TaxID=181172 RepID=A0ABR3Q869_9TREE
MSADTYLDTLLASAGEPGPQTAAHREWEALLSSFEAEGAADPHAPPPLKHSRSPWPTLHDLLGQDADLAREDEHDAELAARVAAMSVEPGPSEHAAPSVDVDSLRVKLHNHLPPSAVISLFELLASPTDDDGIQSGLVEVLGFEGEGFNLVHEILVPGVRSALVAAERGKKKGGKVNHAYAQPSKTGRKKIDITDIIGTNEDIERRIQEQLHRPKAMFVDESQQRVVKQEVLPNVFTSGSTVTQSMSYGGRFALPIGTEREQTDQWEEVTVPPPTAVPPKATEKPVLIRSLPPLARGCFPGYTSLNRMQSVVHPIAMGTNENMLVCAPTGAGKTDVALMTIIRVLQSHVKEGPSSHSSGFTIDKDKFKVIYVAPMKALAAEITRKFGKKLAWLGIKVRELTGDMQMTRQEIAETQVIVTTPEKWDVVTRKPTGEGELASKVRLLIIDEVHLLNEERGAVIETIVARTLRQVESSQSLIRIVGLSATLPNYIDVSDFLRVNRYQGLFFFDSSFRPVPLEQHFIGVKGKARSATQTRNMEQAVYDKVIEQVRAGHQVMVFVHARKETVKTAQRLKEMATEEASIDLFDTREHPKFQFYRRDIGTSRNKEMKELFDYGFGIHHAGMLRSDRAMMERMFEDNAIKVLCCTSTLAWGVNLPAHAVVIKGTQVYDSNRGSFVDLSVLDVLQIFGRAGRPGYETEGVGFICTSQDKLDHYLYSIMSQQPIESKFIPGMVDALNAEISLGTISNSREAISWIGYTYLFVRMRREPFIYGMSHDEPRDDPQLGNKRNDLVTQAARQLAKAKMIRFDEVTNTFAISDLGRIAARYYLRHQTVEVFNELFNPRMKNADIFAMLAKATEFAQIQIRDTEVEELTTIMDSDSCPMEVKGGATSAEGKVNILLQAHISRVFIEDFALVSDTAYVAQNAGRIIRALLEIALSRNWANCAFLLVDLSKAIEKRMWPYEHPLAQVSTLHRDTLFNLRKWADDTEISELREMDAKTLGARVHMNATHGEALHRAALMFPTIGVQHALRPLAHDLLQITLTIEPQFHWSDKLSGSAEPFYVWIQDAEGLHILQWRSILLRKETTSLAVDFVIPWTPDAHKSLSIVTASDRWLGSDSETPIHLEQLVMPKAFEDHTPLLDLPFLPIAALDDPDLVKLYRPHVPMLNGIQSQAFWSVYHTDHNVLVSAPVSSGKSLLGELALWHLFRHAADALAVVIVPHARAASETAARIRSVVPKGRKISVTSVRTTDAFDKAVGADGGRIVVATPTALDLIANSRLTELAGKLSLVLLEDLHLLDAEYELTITKLLSVVQPQKTRVVGLACTLSDPSDIGNWLKVEPSYRFCFTPKDRGAPIVVQLKTFTIAHSTTLLKTMIKPTYDIIKGAANGGTPGSVIVFVPSRGAGRIVARDLVTQSGTEMDLNGFLNAQRADVEPLVERLRDPQLLEPLLHGIGYILPGMAPSDLAIVLELFASGIVRALIAPRESCWTLPVRASTVVLMGAQYMRFNPETEDRQVVAYSRQELVRMQGFAVLSAHPAGAGGRMFVMCQAEQQTAIARVLADGLSLESALPAVLKRDVSSEAQAIKTLERMIKARDAPRTHQINRPREKDLRKRDMLDLIGYTMFGWRVRTNPTFYDMLEGTQAEQLSRLVDEWFANQPKPKVQRKVINDEDEEQDKSEERGEDEEEKPEAAPAPVPVAAADQFKIEEEVVVNGDDSDSD